LRARAAVAVAHAGGPAIHIRLARPDDAEAISALATRVQALHAAAEPGVFRPAGAATFAPATVQALIALPGHQIRVATVDGAVAGYAYASLRDVPETPWKYATRVCAIEQMGVDERHRRRGLGARLLAAVRGGAAAWGAAELRLSVWEFNEEARAFYARQGFTSYQRHLRLGLGEPPA
jgi:GNAT superfamily N-acetyltransferase